MLLESINSISRYIVTVITTDRMIKHMSIAISSIKQHLGGRTNATDDFGTYF